MQVKHGLVWDGYHFIPIDKMEYLQYVQTGEPKYWEVRYVPQEWKDEADILRRDRKSLP